jgi:formiminotetrahydrofolate cyclodeaminase
MLAIRAESERWRLRLTEMVEDDVAAFDGLMAAYKRPKSTDEEKARRSAAIQENLIRATEVPLECARACAAVIALARRASERGYKGVISDAGVGVLSAYAALRSAALNVYINAPSLEDREAAERYVREIDRLVADGSREHEAVFSIVRAKL